MSLEPADAGCRSEHCYEEGGCDCGYTLAEVQAEMVAHHRGIADRLAAMSPAEFLRHMGYHDQREGPGDGASPSPACGPAAPGGATKAGPRAAGRSAEAQALVVAFPLLCAVSTALSYMLGVIQYLGGNTVVGTGLLAWATLPFLHAAGAAFLPPPLKPWGSWMWREAVGAG